MRHRATLHRWPHSALTALGGGNAPRALQLQKRFRAIFWLLHLLTVFSFVFALPARAQTVATNVPYLDPMATPNQQTAPSATVLTGTETSLNSGWYVCNATLNYTITLTINSSVGLILADGCQMGASSAIPIFGGSSGGNGGTVIISGNASVTATGGGSGPGIGSGSQGTDAGSVSVATTGTVIANGGIGSNNYSQTTAWLITTTASAGGNASLTGDGGTVSIPARGSGTVSENAADTNTAGTPASATFTPNTGYVFSQVSVNGANDPTAITAGNYAFAQPVGTNHTISAMFVLEQPIATAALTLAAPVTGQPLSTRAGVNGSTFAAGPVSWMPAGTVAAPGTAYTAQVTLTPTAGYTLADLTGATIDGNKASVTINADGTATLSYAFAATAPLALLALLVAGRAALKTRGMRREA